MKRYFYPSVLLMTHRLMRWGGLSSMTIALLMAGEAQGQVVPDATLGQGNNSVTGTIGNRTNIGGGLQRNSSLFHSFERFDVLTNQQVYFANPTNVRNIFSRVTGNGISSIDGVLGVTGNANLFFMNPNGIVFGPNARLDVSGSFLATTANALNFADGQQFAATGDRSVPLVEVNIPIGLQFGSNAPAMLTSRGDLAAGQNLTLAAGNLDLQGQVRSGGDLTLNATDTVKIRDTVGEAFLARSGGNMTIQGNQMIDVLTLNHLTQTPFVSNGNLNLVSDGNVSGDAHYEVGGNFSIFNTIGGRGNFLSIYDPTITAAGNVTFGNYTGASLKVIAGGSIITGSIIINAIDLALGPNPIVDLQAGVVGTINTQPFPGNIGFPATPITTTSATTPASITINGNINTNFNNTIPDGNVILKATGPIKIGSVPVLDNSIVARSITIDTPSSLEIAGGLNSRLVTQPDPSTPIDAGDILIGTIIKPSSIKVGIISSRNTTAGGNGGKITVNTTGNFETTGAFTVKPLGGYRDPATSNPNIDPDIVSLASEASNGKSGDVRINAGGQITLAAGISSKSNLAGQGGGNP